MLTLFHNNPSSVMPNPQFQIVVTDDTGVNTFNVKEAKDMLDAMRKVEQNLKTKHISSISAITATTL